VSEPKSSLILVGHLHVYGGVWLRVDLRRTLKKNMGLISQDFWSGLYRNTIAGSPPGE
jgi:hypothetical protein